MALMGLREYARHRGVGLFAVQEAIRRGRIERGPGGKIDSAAADTQWEANIAPQKRVAVEASSGRQNWRQQFLDARQRKEAGLAALRTIEVRRQQGHLLEVAALEKQWFEAGKTLQKTAMNIPARFAADLAGRTDAGEIEGMLAAEIEAAVLDFEQRLRPRHPEAEKPKTGRVKTKPGKGARRRRNV